MWILDVGGARHVLWARTPGLECSCPADRNARTLDPNERVEIVGLATSRDLAIVGYTDTPLSTLVDPPLTMVEVPAREIGTRAMRTLSDLIDGKKPRRRRTVLPAELIVRESCGPH